MAGGISNIVSSPDGRTVAFVNGGGGGGGRGGAGAGGGQTLYTVAVDAGAVTRVAQATLQTPNPDDPPAPAVGGGFAGGISNVQWMRDGRTLYFRQGRGIYSAALGGAGG